MSDKEMTNIIINGRYVCIGDEISVTYNQERIVGTVESTPLGLSVCPVEGRTIYALEDFPFRYKDVVVTSKHDDTKPVDSDRFLQFLAEMKKLTDRYRITINGFDDGVWIADKEKNGKYVPRHADESGADGIEWVVEEK